jgi:hypothetical protein
MLFRRKRQEPIVVWVVQDRLVDDHFRVQPGIARHQSRQLTIMNVRVVHHRRDRQELRRRRLWPPSRACTRTRTRRRHRTLDRPRRLPVSRSIVVARVLPQRLDSFTPRTAAGTLTMEVRVLHRLLHVAERERRANQRGQRGQTAPRRHVIHLGGRRRRRMDAMLPTRYQT